MKSVKPFTLEVRSSEQFSLAPCDWISRRRRLYLPSCKGERRYPGQSSARIKSAETPDYCGISSERLPRLSRVLRWRWAVSTR